jgi:acyl-CoA thioesterase-1
MVGGMRRFAGILLAVSLAAFSRAGDSPARIVVLGDSLAAGYGVTPEEAWPARIQSRIDTAQLPYTVVNAGVSGDTTAGGVRRIDWLLRQPIDILILELGGNDGLRGIPPTATRSNLLGIVRKTRGKSPQTRIVLAGMQMPPSMGRDYSEAFQKVFPEVAQAERLALVPHLLESVGGVPELNQPDLIHPTPAGHELIASNVWQILSPLLVPDRSPPAPVGHQ